MLKRLLFPLLLASAAFTPETALCAFAKNAPGLFLSVPDALPPVAKGQLKKNKDTTVVLSADQLGFDQETGIVIARGKVEASQGDSILFAEQITYYQQTDKMIAQGNVTMMQPSGDVLFADHVELTDSMKKGVIEAFQARLADNSVFVADQAVKVNAAVTEMHEAKYTPCTICQGMAPFWQLNGGEVRIDEAKEKVIYHDVTMDVYGVPVFYSPYLSHPTPNSEAKSGFLNPQYANNGNLGTVVKTPFYWRIGNDKDAVITPWYTGEDGLLLQGDYRQLSDHGEYHIQGALTDPQKLDDNGQPISGHELRGYISAQGTEAITPHTDLGFDIQRSTDETFLRRYSLGSQPTLFSRLFAETAENRNYGLVQGLAIQGLRTTDNSHTTPLILPSVQSYYETRPDAYGIRYHLSEDVQSLTRDEGIDQSRLSLTAGAALPYITDEGHVFTTTLNLRQDAYRSENVPLFGGTQESDATTYRTVPQAGLEWRYPLINPMAQGTMTVEPIILTVLQPNGGNPSTISNEDSRLLELTDTNIFSLNRMPGIDLVDSGSRIAYGARSQYLFKDGTSVDALLGQNYNFGGNTPFPNSTRPGDDFSDYVGRVAWNVMPLTLGYRFALDSERLDLNRNEFLVNFAKPWLSVATSYRSIDKNSYITNSREGQIDIAFPLDENWSLHGGMRRDFDLGQFVTQNSGFLYKNECFNIAFDAVRNFTRDRDVEPSTQYLVRVGFKNLGEFGGR